MAVPLIKRGDFLRLDRRTLALLRKASPHDLILVTPSVDAEMMTHGYGIGIFAMPIPGNDAAPEVYAWYLPGRRAVIPLPPLAGTLAGPAAKEPAQVDTALLDQHESGFCGGAAELCRHPS